MININFIKTAIKDYKVGAFTESSKYVVRKVVSRIRPEYKYIVEYGAGNGVVTKEILRRLPPDGRLVAVELNENFVAELKKIKDPRLRVVKGDVAAVSKNLFQLGLPKIDAVISGIPFSFIKPEARGEIVRDTHAALADGGMFLVYQYSTLLLPALKKCFAKTRILFEPRNFLPYFIMEAEK